MTGSGGYKGSSGTVLVSCFQDPEKMKSLNDMYMALIIRMNEFQDHKTRQIDENRKIFKRNVNHEERIEKLEDYMEMEDRITAIDFMLRIKTLEDFIAQNYQNDLLLIFRKLEKLEIALEGLTNPEKKKHVCPACNGEGYWHDSHDGIAYGAQCKPCNGVGVIWG